MPRAMNRYDDYAPERHDAAIDDAVAPAGSCRCSVSVAHRIAQARCVLFRRDAAQAGIHPERIAFSTISARITHRRHGGTGR
jgi:hypothetical protein